VRLPVRRAAAHPRDCARGEDQGDLRSRRRCTRDTRLRSVDDGNNVGYVAAYRGAEIAIAKAQQAEIAAIGVDNSYFSGRNAYYLERIVNAGLVGLHTATARRTSCLPAQSARPLAPTR
jgi:LDH2 family malate/lactate/ureidoglycolate dehydrogenase